MKHFFSWFFFEILEIFDGNFIDFLYKIYNAIFQLLFFT